MTACVKVNVRANRPTKHVILRTFSAANHSTWRQTKPDLNTAWSARTSSGLESTGATTVGATDDEKSEERTTRAVDVDSLPFPHHFFTRSRRYLLLRSPCFFLPHPFPSPLRGVATGGVYQYIYTPKISLPYKFLMRLLVVFFLFDPGQIRSCQRAP